MTTCPPPIPSNSKMLEGFSCTVAGATEGQLSGGGAEPTDGGTQEGGHLIPVPIVGAGK